MSTFGFRDDDALMKEFGEAINRCSRENESNTPDFILGEFLVECLVAFEKASMRRENWYGKHLSIEGITGKGFIVEDSGKESLANEFKLPCLKGAESRLDVLFAECRFDSDNQIFRDWTAVKFALKAAAKALGTQPADIAGTD